MVRPTMDKRRFGESIVLLLVAAVPVAVVIKLVLAHNVLGRVFALLALGFVGCLLVLAICRGFSTKLQQTSWNDLLRSEGSVFAAIWITMSAFVSGGRPLTDAEFVAFGAVLALAFALTQLWGSLRERRERRRWNLD